MREISLSSPAKPGYEFIGEGSPTHVGGASHGGLHKQDSFVSSNYYQVQIQSLQI